MLWIFNHLRSARTFDFQTVKASIWLINPSIAWPLTLDTKVMISSFLFGSSFESESMFRGKQTQFPLSPVTSVATWTNGTNGA